MATFTVGIFRKADATPARIRLSQVARDNGWAASRGVGLAIRWERGRQWLYADFDRRGRVTYASDGVGLFTGRDRAAQVATVLAAPPGAALVVKVDPTSYPED